MIRKFKRVAVRIRIRAWNARANVTSTTFKGAVSTNLSFLDKCSKYLCFPLTIKDEVLSVSESRSKRFCWACSQISVLLRILLGIAAVILNLTFDRFWNPLFFPVYLIDLISTSLGFCCGITSLMLHVESFVLAWNFILKYKSTVNAPKVLSWMFQIFPLSGCWACLVYSIFLALSPSYMMQFRFLLVSARAEGHLTSDWFYYALLIACSFVDFWAISVSAASRLSVITFHMMFLETWRNRIVDFIRSSKADESFVSVNQIWRPLSELLVALRVFNSSNATIVFMVKLTSLTCGIFTLSSSLLVPFHGDFVLSAIMIYLIFVAPLVYPMVYFRAYDVSAGLQKAKLELRRFPRANIQGSQLERKLASISTKGIQVGGFQSFERESVLIFFDFLINQVVSIVLAYK